MSDAKEEKLVLPGDALGTSEEVVPGRGTYEYNGQVYAALMGHPHVDAQSRTVSVRAVHEIPHMTEGELVYARVDEMKSALLITQLLSSVRTGRTVPGNPEGTLHISKAKESYVEELSREFAIGDILKAEVIQGYPVVKLSTQGPDLGVVSARCTDCHAILNLAPGAGAGLVCPRCGRREQRKTSREYGGRKGPSHHATHDAPLEGRHDDPHAEEEGPGPRRHAHPRAPPTGEDAEGAPERFDGPSPP